jgi:hypothetical protein
MRRIGDRDENEERDRARRDRVSTRLAIDDGSMELDINEQMSCLQIMDGSQESQITVAYTPDPIIRLGERDRIRATHDFLAARRPSGRPSGFERLTESNYLPKEEGIPTEIETQPPSQITFNGNQVLNQLLKHFEEIFDLAIGDPDLVEVYHAGRAFINNHFPQLNGNMSGINSVLKAIFTKVKYALNADKKLRDKRLQLEQFLTDSFQEFVNREREEILQMDVVELQQMVKALTSLTT